MAACSTYDAVKRLFETHVPNTGLVPRGAFRAFDGSEGLLHLVCDVLFPGGEATVPYQPVLDFLSGEVPEPLPTGLSESERWARWALFSARVEARNLQKQLDSSKQWARWALLSARLEARSLEHQLDALMRLVLAKSKRELNKTLEDLRQSKEDVEEIEDELHEVLEDHQQAEEERGDMLFASSSAVAGRRSRPRRASSRRIRRTLTNSSFRYISESAILPGGVRQEACFGHIRLNLPNAEGNFDGIAIGAGLVVCSPKRSPSLVVCDLRRRPEVQVTHIDISHVAGEGRAKFEGCAFDGVDSFVCGPRNSSQLLVYSVSSGEVRGIDITHIAANKNKYTGIAYGEGLFVCMPFDADNLLLYRPATDEVKGVDVTHVVKGDFKFNKVAYGEGLFVGAPRSSDQILCYRPTSNETWGVPIRHCINGNGFSQFSDISYGGGLFVMAPWAASFVLAYRPSTGAVLTFPVTGFATSTQKFAGCAFSTGVFLFAPFREDCMLRFDPEDSDRPLRNLRLPSEYGTRQCRWGRCRAGDDLVACSPYACRDILLYRESEYVRQVSEEHGLSVGYMLSEFKQLTATVTGDDDPNFHELKDLVYGERAVGFGKTCPRDGKPNCSLVDALPRGHRGKATHFLSWVWGYKLSAVLGALQSWIERHHEKEAFIWMCFACNNQFRILGRDRPHQGAEKLKEVFEMRLTGIGKMLALIDNWKKPVYHTRIWTQFEQYTAAKFGVPVTMILPPEEIDSLQQELDPSRGLEGVVSALWDIDAERAKATVEEDERAVKQIIREGVGFEALNTKVRQSMVECVTTEFKVVLESAASSPSRDSQKESWPLRRRMTTDSSLELRTSP